MSNSDYTKNNTDFYDLLPQVYQNDYTKALFNNLFNRYVTKDELEHVDGYIGTGNPEAVINRNIKEPTPHRQAFQLQPMLYSKFGTVEHMMTWKDLINEMENTGIDTSTFKDWLTSQKFNWVPPIDIDKLLHYQDYYWYNPDKPTDMPQYLTIKNLCNTVEAKVTLYEKILSSNGAEFNITNIDTIKNTISISSDKSGIFSNGFLFYIKDSLNTELNNSFWITDSVSYDSITDTTEVKVTGDISNGLISGILSLSEFSDILKTERDCICNGSIGFDYALFDDNQLETLLWNTNLLASISYPSFIDYITVNPTEYDLWYDTSTDTIYQYNEEHALSNGTDKTDITNWKIIHRNFSYLIGRTEGQHFFDLSIGCTFPQNEWVDQNHWVHKSVIPNFSIAKQADIPIIEFNPFLELNEWTCIDHAWSYRKNKFTDYEEVDQNPTLIELIDISDYALVPGEITLHSKYGDQSDTFISGYGFNILDSEDGIYSISNIVPGFGGTFTVVGDITQEYTTINDVINSEKLPSNFNIRNSPGGVLDGEWTIDSIDSISVPGKSIISVISTESINTFSFTGAEIYQSNTGSYEVEYSQYKQVKTSYQLASSPNFNTNQISVIGDLTSDIAFDGFFYTEYGVFAYDIAIFNGITTDITVLETLPSNFNPTEIFIEEFRTVISVTNDSFNLYQDVSSRLSPLTTSKGDQWIGPNSHWVYKGIKSVNPINRQNCLPGLSIDKPVQHNSTTYGSGNYDNNDFEYKVNQFVQYFLVKKTSGISSFEFHKAISEIALPNSNSVRVYIKNENDNKYIRQYGTFTEIISNGFVSGIEFNVLSPVVRHSEIKIEVGPNIIEDIGFANINVRTEESDEIYDLDPIANSIDANLYEFDKYEQVKSEINQYPLFDLYDTNGESKKDVSSIFEFKEDASYDINFSINKRIVTSNNDFDFTHGLADKNTGELFAYRDNKVSHMNYFVNSSTNIVYIWKNFTWNTKILLDDIYLNPIVSEQEPTNSNYLIKGMIWYNPLTEKLKIYNTSFEDIAFELDNVDPTLKTIWQPGINDESYEPKYVDENKEEIAIGSELGQWEIPDPMYYNLHHENRNEISLLYLTSHFDTIISSQEPIAGFNDAPNNTFHINTNPNYGLGGTIREYNDGLDILFASLFINTTTTNKVLEFAQNQYESALISIKEIFIRNVTSYLTDTSIATYNDLENSIINDVISKYESNDSNTSLYYDSPTYGHISNWIATAPMFGFADNIKPYLIDKNEYIIKHHDGHISINTILDTVKESSIVNLLKTEDIRTDNGQFYGNTQSQYIENIPSTESEFYSKYNATQLTNGKYWYRTQNGQRELFRLNLKEVTPIQPGFSYTEGDKWYDTGTQTLYEFNSGIWNIVSNYGDGNISKAWDKIDLDLINSKLIVEVETKLYESIDQSLDKTDLTEIKANSLFSKYELEYFNQYALDTDLLLPLSQIGIYNSNNPFTWNYLNSDLQVGPYLGSPTGTEIGGCWQDLYEKIYGTAYPHKEPWILQGYIEKPIWWDNEYLDTTETRKWDYNHSTQTGMWTNILDGIVPVGKLLPSNIISLGNIGEVTQYSYLSVNIDDVQHGQYESDDILPPFWDYRNIFGSGYIGPIRSLYYDFSTQVTKTNSDFKFGDSGTHEWIWKHSSGYIYDLLKIFFRINPLKFYYDTFGIEYTIIDKLQINKNSKKVYSHNDGLFHGDVFNRDQVFSINGVNQWYTNYNRYFGIDSHTSNFKTLWKDYTTPLTYSFASFIDTESVDIQNKNFDLVESDLNVSMKKSLGISDTHIDALNISVLKIPNLKLAYSTTYDWIFNLYTNIVRDIEYYDVLNFPVIIEDNTLTMYKFKIRELDSDNNLLSIPGDWSHIFDEFEIVDSTTNNGIYSVDTILYNTTTNSTVIKTNESLDDSIVDGYVQNQYRKHGWESGQEVVFESTALLPRPFIANQLYYVIKINDYQFQLSDTRVDALDDNYIIIEDNGTGQLFVGQIEKTFNALSSINNPDIWKSYEIDRNNILTFNRSIIVYGIQNIINIAEGYAAMLTYDGWRFNNDNIEVDVVLGRTISWQLEIEKFINELAIIQNKKLQTSDTYTFESVSGILTFLTFNPSWSTGSKIILTSDILPEPLLPHTPYFIIRDENDQNIFSLAATTLDARNGNSITILSDGLESTIELFNVNNSIFIFELNPFRNNIWYENNVGIISNIIEGPFNDINIDNTIYDQDTNVLTSDLISIYREDSIAKISMNSYATINDQHLAGFHLFVDGYEHVLFFENYSSEGFLIYDPYIGLNTSRFDIIFDKQNKFTLRPNLGGRFLTNETEFISNLESLTKNLEEAYSTYSTSESNTMTKLARRSLGYDKTEQTFLDKLEINDKSQFIFWKGLLQHKGSTNAINAFINSRRFVDAKVDEYWFYKIGEFGDVKRKMYPEIHISPSDTLSNELKIEFNKLGESVEQNFKPITLTDNNEWFEYPNQQPELESNFKEHFYFNTEITDIYPNDENILQASFDINGSPVEHKGTLWFINSTYYFKTDKAFDSVLVQHGTNIITSLIENTDFTIINSRLIQFNIDPRTYTELKISILNVAKSKHNPLKIIDYKSDVKLLDIPIWDPGKNHNYHITENLIDLKRDTDPAEYTDIIYSVEDNTLDAWTSKHNSIIWMDTSLIEYYPYYDKKIEPFTTERIRNWGTLSDFTNIELYQWTESKLHPSEWNDIASVEEDDKSIDESIRKSGSVRELVFNTTTNSYEKSYKYFDEYHVLDNTLVFQIDSLTLQSIEQSDIDSHIESIEPKYNIKGYVNNKHTANVEFVQTINTIDTTIDIVITFPSVNDYDLKTIIWFGYDLVEDNERIYPTEAELDEGLYQIDIPFSKVIKKNSDLTDDITYYYWVKDKTIKINSLLSMVEIKRDIVNIPIPYTFMQNYLPSTQTLPNRYNQVVLKGLGNTINDYNRYKLRFIHDFTLRDNIDDGKSLLNLKTTHAEWKLFREKQPYHIDRYLWDRVTESVLGETLDGSKRIPHLDKELYDIENFTNTRYGLGQDKLFADKNLIIEAIYQDLYNPDNDFFPIDIDSFIQLNNFDTIENSRKFMNDLYNKFASIHLNRIFFSILHIAFSKNLEYDNIQKSSMISLHGIRILESRGIYDD